MKKPEETSCPDFTEYMWMAEEGAEEDMVKQVEEEMELIEQDFLEAMFDDLLREEEEKESYYGPPDEIPSQFYSPKNKNNAFSMQLPKIQSELNPNAPAFVPRFGPAAVSS